MKKNPSQALADEELDAVNGGWTKKGTGFTCKKCGRFVKMQVTEQILYEYEKLGFLCTNCVEVPSVLRG